MGVLAYIRYMDVPEDCDHCDSDFAQAIHCNHWIEGQYQGKGRPSMCPLFPIEDGPGNCISVTVKREAIE